MNPIIKIEVAENMEQAVSARELHEFLEVGTHFKDWFPRMCEYGFEEGKDYTPLKNEQVRIEGSREVKRDLVDYHMTIPMAKEISMIQRNDKGKQARQYFLQVEAAWNNPEMMMARSLQYANQKLIGQAEQIEILQLETKQKDQIIGELQPKADYLDGILNSKELVTITQIAKDYGMSGSRMNQLLKKLKVQYKQSDQWLLYGKHHAKGYTHSETIRYNDSENKPQVKMNTKWTQKGRLFIYELLKNNGTLPVIERA